MEVVLAVIIGFILYRMFAYKGSAAIISKACMPHKWEYRKQPDSEDEYMICANCEKTPTEVVNGQ